jgi:hypothetical protein
MEQAVAQRLKNSQPQNVNDPTRYLGYSGGVPNMTIDPKDSSLTCNPLYGGVLLTFTATSVGYLGGWDTMKGGFRRQYTNIQPWENALTVDRKFHLTEDLGYRTLPMLKKLPYGVREDDSVFDEAEDYFGIVHPLLASCPFGLNQKIVTTEPSVGHADAVWQHCPTCQLAHLKSNDCMKAIDRASDRDYAILLDLRKVLIEANEAALRYVGQKTDLILGDINNRKAGQQIGRTGMNTIDRIMLKMQHRKEEHSSDPVQVIAQAFQQATGGMQQGQIFGTGSSCRRSDG